MSASPAPKDEDQSNRVAFRFCRECSNMLYPRENSNTNELVFACGMCDFEDKAVENKCVWRHELSNTVGETAGITQDVSADPSLPRVQKACPKCDDKEAVFFQSQQRTAETGMKLWFVCCGCGYCWQ